MSLERMESQDSSGWPRYRGWVLLLLFLVVTGAANVVQSFDTDSTFYQEMAHGDIGSVSEPFRSRVLQPMLVRAIGSAIGEVPAFAIVTLVSAGLFLWGAAVFLRREDVPAGVIQVALAGCWLANFASEVFLPDMLGMALAVGLLLLMQRGRCWLAAGVLLPLTVARESYVLLGVLFCIVMFRHRLGWQGLFGLGVSLLGSGLANLIAGDSKSVHGFSGPLYLILKMPFNFIKNLFGVEIWTNTLSEAYLERPSVVHPVPSWLKVGSITEYGLLPWSYENVAGSLVCLIALFGLGSALAWRFRREMTAWCKERPSAALELAAVSGLAMFVLAPVTGASIVRLVGYGWTLFVLVLPVVWVRYVDSSGANQTRLLWAQVGLATVPLLLLLNLYAAGAVAAFVAVIGILVWIRPEVSKLKWRGA